MVYMFLNNLCKTLGTGDGEEESVPSALALHDRN